jgi:RNA polymerase sigma-70 factor (ECF subfamily)
VAPEARTHSTAISDAEGGERAAMRDSDWRTEPTNRALSDLFSRFGDRIYRLGLYICATPQDAEDMVQETFLRALQGWEGFEGRSSPYTWLCAIAARVAKRQHRRRVGEPRQLESLQQLLPSGEESIVDIPSGDASSLSEMARREAEAQVERCVVSLPLRYQLPLVLKDIGDFSAAEIGQILGIRPGTVRSRVYRARMEVRRRLAEVLPQRASVSVDHTRRICLDLLLAKQEALDHGVEFPYSQGELCDRCHSVFSTLDLARDVFQRLHQDGELAPEVRQALDRELEREYGQAGETS